MVQQHGRFERVCVLGSGTRTVTEKARVGAGASAGRVVTLVVLLPHAEAEPAARAAFLDKGRVLMQLEEGTIAETLELGRSRTHYLAREFIDGVSLRKLSARRRTRGLALPPAFGCDVAVQLATSVMTVHQKIRKLSPRLAHTSFGATLRTLVVTSTGRVRWVDPFALDDVTLPRVSAGDPSGDDVSGLAGLLYELLVGRKAPRPAEFTEFGLVAPSSFRSAIPPALDYVVARGLGFARPAFHGMGAFADAVSEAATELAEPEPSWLDEIAELAEVERARPAGGSRVTGVHSLPPATAVTPLDARLQSTRPGTARLLPAVTMRAQTPPRPMPSFAPPLPMRVWGPVPEVVSSTVRPRLAGAAGPVGSSVRVLPPAPARGLWARLAVRSFPWRTIALASTGLVLLTVSLVRIAIRPRSVAAAASVRPRLTASVLPLEPRPEVGVVAGQRWVHATARAGTPTRAVRLEMEELPLPEVTRAPVAAPPAHAAPRVLARTREREAPAAATGSAVQVAAPASARGADSSPAVLPASIAPAREALAEPSPVSPAASSGPLPAAPAGSSGLALRLPYSSYIASRRIKGEDPKVPAALRRSLPEGRAAADVCVGPDGRVSGVRMLEASAGLDEAVRTAVASWRYRPFTSHGQPIPVCFEMKFHFMWSARP